MTQTARTLPKRSSTTPANDPKGARRNSAASKTTKTVSSTQNGERIDRRNAAWQGRVDRNLTNFFMSLGLLSASFFVAVQAFFLVPAEYQLPTTDDYRLIELKSLADPVYTDAEAGQYALDVFDDFMSVNRLQTKRHFQSFFQDKFTENGRRVTATSLIDSGNWDLLKSGDYDTEFTPSSAPLLTENRYTDGRYTWVYSVGGEWLWHEFSTRKKYPIVVNATIYVVRESKLKNNDGKAIDGMVIEVVRS